MDLLNILLVLSKPYDFRIGLFTCFSNQDYFSKRKIEKLGYNPIIFTYKGFGEIFKNLLDKLIRR